MQLEPLRITQNQTCAMLAISREALRKLIQNDPNFPRPFKTGTSRQCGVYFDYQAVKKWHNEKMQVESNE